MLDQQVVSMKVRTPKLRLQLFWSTSLRGLTLSTTETQSFSSLTTQRGLIKKFWKLSLKMKWISTGGKASFNIIESRFQLAWLLATVIIAFRKNFPLLGEYSMDSLAKHFGVPRLSHDALEDSQLLRQLVQHALGKNGKTMESFFHGSFI
jgi:hypothetical protein